MKTTLIALLLILSQLSYAKKICKHDKNTFRCVKYVTNYDGDTITVNISNVHDLIGKKINIRIKGIDTPEISSKNKCEKAMADKAKKAVFNFFKNAKRIDLQNVGRGKYFRIVADVIVDKKSLAKHLTAKGLAYPYDSKKKKKLNWCKLSIKQKIKKLK